MSMKHGATITTKSDRGGSKGQPELAQTFKGPPRATLDIEEGGGLNGGHQK